MTKRVTTAAGGINILQLKVLRRRHRLQRFSIDAAQTLTLNGPSLLGGVSAEVLGRARDQQMTQIINRQARSGQSFRNASTYKIRILNFFVKNNSCQIEIRIVLLR